MFKMFITDAVVSKGYDNNPPLRFFDGEKGSSVSFRIGKRVYDSRSQDNHRWINLNVKAFGGLCERIRKMKLKDGSFVNIIGRYDEETSEDKETGKTRKFPVVIVDDIEYCYSGGQKNDQNGVQGNPDQGQPAMPPQGQYSAPPQGQYGASPQNQHGAPPQESYGMPSQGSYGGAQPQGSYGAQPQGQPSAPPPPMPDNFTGYVGLNPGENPYF